MFQNERCEKIYEILQQRGSVTVPYLEKQLYVSAATIRRDLESMEKRTVAAGLGRGHAAYGRQGYSLFRAYEEQSG